VFAFGAKCDTFRKVQFIINYKNMCYIMEKKEFILTSLPLVYKRNCQLLVSEGLDLKRKDELWGIQLSSGVMVALKCDDDFILCKEAIERAEALMFNGKRGNLPVQLSIEARDKKSFNFTVKVLKEHGINADLYIGMVWCILCSVLRCSLPLGGGGVVPKDRLVVAF